MRNSHEMSNASPTKLTKHHEGNAKNVRSCLALPALISWCYFVCFVGELFSSPAPRRSP